MLIYFGLTLPLLLHKLQQKMVSALNQARFSISTFEHTHTKNAVFSCWTFVPIVVDAPPLANDALPCFLLSRRPLWRMFNRSKEAKLILPVRKEKQKQTTNRIETNKLTFCVLHSTSHSKRWRKPYEDRCVCGASFAFNIKSHRIYLTFWKCWIWPLLFLFHPVREWISLSLIFSPLKCVIIYSRIRMFTVVGIHFFSQWTVNDNRFVHITWTNHHRQREKERKS